MPKISVISPVYNGSKYISNLIKSLKRQKFKDFEFLLINDGSTDNTIDIANKELKKSKLNYKIINQENGGQSKARNTGIKNATGDWIVMIDSDDTIQENFLNNLFRASQVDDCDVVFCDLNRVDENSIFDEKNDEFEYNISTGKEYFEKFFMHQVEVGPVSLFIKNDYLKKQKILFDEKSKYSEEFIFINELFYNAKNVIHLKQRLYNYCLRKNSVSTGSSINKIVNGFNEILKESKNYNTNSVYCQKYQKYALSRWILATARFSSKNLKYKNYKELLKSLSYRHYIKSLFDFPDWRIRLASKLLFICPFAFYIIFKYRGNY